MMNDLRRDTDDSITIPPCSAEDQAFIVDSNNRLGASSNHSHCRGQPELRALRFTTYINVLQVEPRLEVSKWDRHYRVKHSLRLCGLAKGNETSSHIVSPE